jgi:small subunit ribosomal protein S16
MAVKLRLKRLGRKHRPFFRLTAIEARNPRDGRVLEELGFYDPENPIEVQQVKLNAERIKYWLGVGAVPS